MGASHNWEADHKKLNLHSVPALPRAVLEGTTTVYTTWGYLRKKCIYIYIYLFKYI